RMDLHAVTKPPHVLVERRFEPAFAQMATLEPARCKRRHLFDDPSRIDIGSAEKLERPRRAAALRKRRALQHYRACIATCHPQVWCVGAGIDPRARAKGPAETRSGFGLPALHFDDLVVDIELECADKPEGKLAERKAMPHRQRPGADETLPAGAEGQTFDRPANGA